MDQQSTGLYHKRPDLESSLKLLSAAVIKTSHKPVFINHNHVFFFTGVPNPNPYVLWPNPNQFTLLAKLLCIQRRVLHQPSLWCHCLRWQLPFLCHCTKGVRFQETPASTCEGMLTTSERIGTDLYGH